MIGTLLSFGRTNILISLAGGVFPALLWLWYWLREDSLHPEPREHIIRTFIAGMFGAIAALLVELAFVDLGVRSSTEAALFGAIGIAAIEELAKYLFAYVVALRTIDYDEPVDAMIYLITTALGFSAFENILFILGTLSKKGLVAALILGDSRFLGATLLHVLASGTLGGVIGLFYYERPAAKRRGLIGGVILAIALHSAYDFFIMPTSSGAASTSVLPVLLSVWGLIFLLLVFFEKVKKVRPSRTSLAN